MRGINIMQKDKNINETIKAKGVEISIISSQNKEDYISLTDMAKFKNAKEPKIVIANWMRNRNTIEFLGLWETINNPSFNSIEFDTFKNVSGANYFVLTPQQWINSTNAIGITSKSGKYGGGTFAHKDIAFKFAAWLSVEFELYVIKDYQRLKESESHQTVLDWNVKRILSKVNYKIHTDAIKDNLITEELTQKEQGYLYASEADLLNVVLFGEKACQWREKNPDEKDKNIRDFATIEQLVVLANLETTNALFIQQGLSQQERLAKLRKMAITILEQIQNTKSVKDLKQLNNQTGTNSPVENLDEE
jgi:hypothetical protein